MMRSAILSLACALLLASVASAQQPGDSTKVMHGPQMNRQRQMNRQMMMQRIQGADARLDRLVTQMNQSTGNKKVQAMAAVINELVAQRKQMHQHMGRMMESGMMEGAQPTAADSEDHSEHYDTAK
jgi:hypothetical protein